MSQTLSQTTCRIHFDRPATARCPSCQLYYCRECITEHDGKKTCAACLNEARKSAEKPKQTQKGLRFFQPAPILQFAVAVIMVWFLFYLIAKTLTGIPDEFHDGTIWKG